MRNAKAMLVPIPSRKDHDDTGFDQSSACQIFIALFGWLIAPIASKCAPMVGVRGDFKMLSSSSLEAAAKGKQVDVL
jgi:hypothetical protein